MQHCNSVKLAILMFNIILNIFVIFEFLLKKITKKDLMFLDFFYVKRILDSIQCTVHSVQCKLYCVLLTVCHVQCVVYSILCL